MHPGDEIAVVLEGQLEVQVGDETVLLQVGDSISFNGNLPHKFTNPGDQNAVVIAAITPPRF